LGSFFQEEKSRKTDCLSVEHSIVRAELLFRKQKRRSLKEEAESILNDAFSR